MKAIPMLRSIGVCILLSLPSWAQEKPGADTPEQRIEAQLQNWQKAMNAGNAEGVAELFTSDGELVDETGRVLKGQPALTAFLTDYFAAFPKTVFELKPHSIRKLGDEVMIAEGEKTCATPNSNVTAVTQFTALYIKQKDDWRLGSWREVEDRTSQSAGDHLKVLEWMVGEWINEQPDSEVHLTCRWSEDKNFLLRDFLVLVGGEVKVKSSQRIGWDPVKEQIRSWNFDSDGGFGEGVWAGGGDRWLVRTTSTLADGRIASALHFLTRDGDDKVTWESTARIVGDEVEADRQATMVRRPPEPLK